MAYFLVPVAAAFRFQPWVTAAAALTRTAAYLGHGLAHRPAAARPGWSPSRPATCSGSASPPCSSPPFSHGGRAPWSRSRASGSACWPRRCPEERERQPLAEALHDRAIQNLLSARHELEEASEATAHPAIARAQKALLETVGELREAVFELHPYVLEQAGLETALATVAERAARRGRFQLRLDAGPVRPCAHDRLLLAAARELLAFAAEHANAAEVRIALAEENGFLRLHVTDDGGGFDPSCFAGARPQATSACSRSRHESRASAGRSGSRVPPAGAQR